jgi:hypothetical protein
MKVISQALSLALGLLLASMLIGCATPTPMSANGDSAIDVVRGQRYADAPGIYDALPKAFDVLAGVDKSPAYTEYTRRWCVMVGKSPTAGRASLTGTQRRLSELCERKGGTFREGFCRGQGEAEVVHFMARVELAGPRGRCQDVQEISATVVEPRDSPADQAYLERLRRGGYLTESEEARRRGLEASQRLAESLGRQAAAERVAQRIEQELPLMKVRGAQVCLQRDGITYVSQVDDAAGDKLRVLNVNAFFTKSPGWKPGGWQPGTAWIDPREGWYLCR